MKRQRENFRKDDKGKLETTRGQGWTQTPTYYHYSNPQPRASGMQNNIDTSTGHNRNFGDSPLNQGLFQLNDDQETLSADRNQNQRRRRNQRRRTLQSDSSTPTNAEPPAELTLVLIGKTGAGKSATGNTILGGKYFRSQLSTNLVTKKCERRSATVQGRNLVVLDTPGIPNTVLPKDYMEQEITRIRKLFTAGHRSVLLLIVPLGRFTEEERQAVDKITQLFSKDVPSRSILVFTHADILKGESIQDFIYRQSQRIQDLVEKFSHRFVAINNKDPNDESQIDQLLKMVDAALQKIQTLQALQKIKTLRLVLVGKTGSGKSATGNTILGRESFCTEPSMSSVTEECQREVATVQGRDLVLIDTPGLFDTSLSQEVVEREIVRCLALSSPGPHVVLLTVRLGGFTEEDWRSIALIEKIFQEEVRRHIILIFTHADLLEDNQIQDFISQDPKLLELVNCFGGRYVAFNNTDTEDPSQVKQLLDMIDSLVAYNDNKFYTHNLIRKMERAVFELLSEVNGKYGGMYQKFHRWCQSHPVIAAFLAAGAGAGLAMGAPLAMTALAPVAVATDVGFVTNIMITMGLNNCAMKALMMKLTGDGILGLGMGGGGAGATGIAGIVGMMSAVNCCIQ